MEFLKWLASTVDRVWIKYEHQPDSIISLSGCLAKPGMEEWIFQGIVLAIMVVISITNEYTYRTLRQNIIDGLSRWEFLLIKNS